MLDVKGLEIRRGKVPIVRNLNFTLHSGSLTALLGPSGAGKSTLFATLTGEYLPYAGTILLAGEDVTNMPLYVRAKRGVGYVPQQASVLWDLTVDDNLRTFARITSMENEAALALVHKVDLVNQRSRLARDLSGGERRRLELARALTARPLLLICDEPFSGVDPQGAAKLAQILHALAQQGVCVLVSDHRAAEVLAVADRGLLMVDGQIVVDAPIQTFCQSAEVRSRYLSS